MVEKSQAYQEGRPRVWSRVRDGSVFRPICSRRLLNLQSLTFSREGRRVASPQGPLPTLTVIHPSAVVSPKAELGHDVEIGPYCVIGEHVRIGDRTRLHSHLVLEGPVTIGEDNEFYPFSSIGARSQDLKYAGEPTRAEIGDRNSFREFVTVHRGTTADFPTMIGSDNNFMAYAHIAHDSVVGNHCILSNAATLGGHFFEKFSLTR